MRLAPKRGKVVYCVGGDLVLATVGSTRTKTALIRGQDLLVRSSRVDSWTERYSDYVYCTQTAGTDDRWGSAAAQIKHQVTDGTIARYRPILVEADAHHKAELQARASLERNQRAGRGERVVATVNGWFTDEGKAWRPNTLVRFRNPVLGIDADLLVVSARFRFGAEEPKETELVLGRPEAFDVVDYPNNKRGEAWR
jgi:prophage tail gpP-like protein